MSIEKELLKLTGLKGQKKKETDQAYLKRILLAIDKADDEKFFALSDETQKWVDNAIDAVEEKKDIPDFDSDEDEDEDEEEKKPKRRKSSKKKSSSKKKGSSASRLKAAADRAKKTTKRKKKSSKRRK